MLQKLGVGRWNWKVVLAVSLLASAPACSGIPVDPGPSWAGFSEYFRTPSTWTGVVVVVVDDRPSLEATELRAGIGAAVQHLAGDVLANYKFLVPDRAPWHAVDLRVVLVPASSASIENVASPANDPALAWITNQATAESRAVLVGAVEAEVAFMKAPPGASFRPLERAADIVKLLRGTRAPSSDVESAWLARTVSNRRKSFFIGVSIVAATDDASPEPAASYRLDDANREGPLNVVTLEGRGKERPAAARYPRFAEWIEGTYGGWGSSCTDDGEIDPPFTLFPMSGCVDYRFSCDARPIAQISPGLGACYIEITTVEPSSCDANRGWVDPIDADGVRRPRVDPRGERVCELLPVEPHAMAACMHDETCADCGGGWCVSEVQPLLAKACPGAPRAGLRWVGGALPEPGSVRITCLEVDDSTTR